MTAVQALQFAGMALGLFLLLVVLIKWMDRGRSKTPQESLRSGSLALHEKSKREERELEDLEEAENIFKE